MRTSQWRRDMNKRKALRKRRIDREVHYYFSTSNSDWYDNLHEYSKNKIHCSCGMCSRYRKTNNKGASRLISGNYAPSKNWKKSDQKRLLEMEYEINNIED